MGNKRKQEWIIVGYNLIAKQGFEKVGVELISRAMEKSKSSFYNYFGDFENYTEELLSFHLSRNKIFIEKVSMIENLRPDFIKLVLEFKYDILFYKQSYKHRDKNNFKEVLNFSFSNYAKTIEEKWVEYFGILNNRAFIQKFHLIIAEHFLMQVNDENYTFEFVDNYLLELTSMLSLLSDTAKE